MVHKTGCGGFPVGRSRYFESFAAVELASTFAAPPKPETAARWLAEAPAGFEFSLRALKTITHSPAEGLPRGGAPRGHFRDSPAVDLAWDDTRRTAEILKARFVVFETPETFYPEANHLRDIYRFFKQIRRSGLSLVWHPRGAWEPGMVSRVCADLSLIPAVNPLKSPGASKVLNYFRLGGFGGISFADAQLREVLAACRDLPSYVFFTHAQSWRDARRFEELRTELSAHVRHLRPL